MNYKVVRDSLWNIIAFGPNDANYEPSIPIGCVLSIEQAVPTLKIDLKAAAQSALNKSDITMMRCVEAGIVAPVAWNTYRKALRAIASGLDTTSTTLPTQPAYPAGT